MKMAPILREMARYPREFAQILVHTGRRDDANMPQVLLQTSDEAARYSATNCHELTRKRNSL